MAGLQASVNITAPILFMMAIGWFLRWRKIVSDGSMDVVNRFCSGVLIPVLMFYNAYTTDLGQAFSLRLLAYAAAAITLMSVISYKITALIEKGPKRRSVTSLAVFRSNFIIFGMVIAENICGEENLGPVMMIAAVVVPLMNFICIAVLEIGKSGKASLARQIPAFIKNPILLAVAAGFLAQALPFGLPAQITQALRDVSRCVSPLSLIILGGMFRLNAVGANMKNLIYGIAGKLIVAPAILIPPAYLLGFRGPELIALACLFIAPVAINLFNFAKSMDADVELAGQFVVLSSLLSVATIFCWIIAFGALGLI